MGWAIYMIVLFCHKMLLCHKTYVSRLRLMLQVWIVVCLLSSCSGIVPAQLIFDFRNQSDLLLPSQTDWVDQGIILEAGLEGEWDYYLWGGFAFSVLKRRGTYYLYYQGSSDYRTEFDETVLWRAIGLATSRDGIHFSKYTHNPIVTWLPNLYGEEGAVSSGVTLGEHGETFIYYGANTQESSTTVNADVRVACAADGINFIDLGVVLDRNDSSVWGSGDELFVVDAIYDQGTWIIYYIPNGTPQGGALGVAYGSTFNGLSQSSAVTSGNKSVPAWGTASHVKISESTYALLINNVRTKQTEVRVFSPQNPSVLSQPIAVYRYDDVQQATILFDEELQTWFLYYRTFDNSYGVKTAVAK